MANNISSIVSAVQRPASAGENGQAGKLESLGRANAGGALPDTGKALPHERANQVVNDEQLREAVNQINDFVQTVQRDLSFSVDEDSGRSVIRVIDSDSGETIRQIPSEEVLALASYLDGYSQGVSGAEAGIPQGILFSDST